MSGTIQLGNEGIKEGVLFNKYLYNRVFLSNKNVILTTTGPTGSGKSYVDLRVAELWYQYVFNKPFPIEHCCFSIDELMRLISKGKLIRGDLLILEEGGVNLGSLDFQNKISKIFTYVLQSFRSLNLILIINLPYVSMLNKSARMLTHANFTTAGIDKRTNTIKVKPKFHQVNEHTGKIYQKYMRANYDGVVRTFKRFVYGLPSKELADKYEEKKLNFVSGLVTEVIYKLDEDDMKKGKRKERGELTSAEQEAYDDAMLGLNCQESAKKRKISNKVMWERRLRCERKGFNIKKDKISKEMQGFTVQGTIIGGTN